jgi:hypothetical protein
MNPLDLKPADESGLEPLGLMAPLDACSSNVCPPDASPDDAPC